MMRIAVLGLWHQGVVGSACLSEAGHEVHAADRDAERIQKLQSGKAPLFEPGLDELLRQQLDSGRLKFSTDFVDCVRAADAVFVMFDTPVDANDESDLTEFFATAREIAPHIKTGAVIFVTAQVPVGSCDAFAAAVRSVNSDADFSMAYSPENLRLGQAIERFRHPPLPVLGADSPEAFERLEKIFEFTGATWERVNVRTAEMTKHALNSFLALSVTFANELGNLCDEVGADGHRLADVLRLEPRVGPKAMLKPGLGFAGGTLARDLQTLRKIGDQRGVDTPLLDGVWTSNQLQNKSVIHRLRRHLGGTLAKKKICVLGLTYKPDTSTLRRSAALEVVAELQRADVAVTASDPRADRAELQLLKGFTFYDDIYAAADGADALVLMTPWKSFLDLKWPELAARMRGRLVLDTANLWSADAVEAAGFTYVDIGRGRGGHQS